MEATSCGQKGAMSEGIKGLHSGAVPASAAALWTPLARLIERERRIGRWAERNGRTAQFAYEFVRFGIKQGWACLFGGLMLGLLLATHFWYPKDALLARYDFLVLGAVAIQAAMLASRLETLDEAKIILAFHITGTAMEIFKISAGSWLYPEPGVLRIAGVPLFSGFMYAAVGSYLARVWRLFDFEFTRHPPLWAVSLLALAVYVNFFLHHYAPDARPLLFAAAALMFGRTWVYYRIWRRHRSMPLLLGLSLVATFIWFAENIGTFSHAWTYPHQRGTWTLVPLTKLGAWFLLMLISYVLAALVQGVRRHRPDAVAGRVSGLQLATETSIRETGET
jgi:uncharacterized membrane protein YoaT (DUF817 family)